MWLLLCQYIVTQLLLSTTLFAINLPDNLKQISETLQDWFMAQNICDAMVLTNLREISRMKI